MDFCLVTLRITIRLEGDSHEPCALFDMRKRFAASFRNLVDCRCSRCDSCLRQHDCPYYQTFSQELSSDPAAVKRYQKPPLPFVFDIPRLPPVPNHGTVHEVGLTVVGSAANYLDHYIAAFRLMLRQDALHRNFCATVLRVESVDYGGNRHLLQEQDSRRRYEGVTLLSLEGLSKSETLPMDRLNISFETPLRIIHDARLQHTISFPVLACSLMRRVSSIAYHYGGVEADTDFKWLAMRSDLVKTSRTNVHWVEWGRGVSGMIGDVTFVGDLADFHPFMLAGEHLHVGKEAAFGLGRIRLEKTG